MTSPAPHKNFYASALLFLATAAFILWQNSQVAVLWDLSYLLDTSWRIALGQLPYRDFPLVHPPLTFLMQAAIMRIAGRHYMLHVAYAAIAGASATVISWRIVLHLLGDRIASAWWVAFLLAAPLVVLGTYSIYPHPIYDGDCALAILIAVRLLQRLGEERAPVGHGFSAWRLPLLAGAASVLPVLIKQNMGVPFLFAVLAGVAVPLFSGWIASIRHPQRALGDGSATQLRLLAGILAAGALAAAAIHGTAGLHNYLRWTLQFAAHRRLPGLAYVLSAYRTPSLLWTLPCAAGGVLLLWLGPVRARWARGVTRGLTRVLTRVLTRGLTRVPARVLARVLAFCLFSAPFAASLIFLLRNRDPDDRAENLLSLWPPILLLAAAVAAASLRKGLSLQRLLPLVVLAAIQGTFLSQSLPGSSYAIWPLLMVLIAGLLAALPACAARLAPALAAVVCVTFLVCGGLYAVSHNRLNYIDIAPQPIQRATLAPLRGLAAPGPYLPEFEELVRFAGSEIPTEDGLLLLPGEDPFYFATGRASRFPVLLFDPTTDPYSPEALLTEARQRNIRWVIVKTHQQSVDDQMPDRERTLGLVMAEFVLEKKLAAYDVYRRIGLSESGQPINSRKMPESGP